MTKTVAQGGLLVCETDATDASGIYAMSCTFELVGGGRDDDLSCTANQEAEPDTYRCSIRVPDAHATGTYSILEIVARDAALNETRLRPGTDPIATPPNLTVVVSP